MLKRSASTRLGLPRCAEAHSELIFRLASACIQQEIGTPRFGHPTGDWHRALLKIIGLNR
ncbi:hypothetical protein [Desulfatirhabdium butyrativorans]|uniref:hypothetical protein n=1 Tax=Desulfatirhabdium butyrativorans TaxID=340467 RepID=UPI00041AA0C4|nr:hypothetical protein [Desulfatirhabdium butyrativorans]